MHISRQFPNLSGTSIALGRAGFCDKLGVEGGMTTRRDLVRDPAISGSDGTPQGSPRF
jgi:hypothetical protein